MLISNTLLNLLEAPWTESERLQIKDCQPKPSPQRTVIATLAFRVRFSKDWRIIRFFTCLAFDATAFAVLCQKARYKLDRGFPSSILNSPQLNEQDVEHLVESLQTGSAIDNFVAATKQKAKIIVKLAELKTGSNLTSSVQISRSSLDGTKTNHFDFLTRPWGKVWQTSQSQRQIPYAASNNSLSTREIYLLKSH